VTTETAVHITPGSAPRGCVPDEKVYGRLVWAAAMYAAVYVIVSVTGSLSAAFAIANVDCQKYSNLSTLFAVFVPAAVILAARSRWLSPAAMADAGLLFAVLAAIACASMTPLFLLVGMARGSANPSKAAMVLFTVPNYVCVLIALANVKILYGLRRPVQEARRMGGYQLKTLLGQGGMGEVWRAGRHTLARPAAIKLMRPSAIPGTGAKTVFRRFEREAQAAAALRSVHTITLYDFGISDDGSFYYVMELLEGLDLQRLVTRFGPAPAARGALSETGMPFAGRGPCHRVDSSRYQAGQPIHLPPGSGFRLRQSAGFRTGEAFHARSRRRGSQLMSIRLAASPVEMVMRHVQCRFRLNWMGAVPACLEKEPAKRLESMMALARLLEPLAAPWSAAGAAGWWQKHLPGLARNPGPARGILISNEEHRWHPISKS
jgi:hypothetical protein